MVLGIRVCVRGAEGAEITPSFGHPSNVRRGGGGTAFGAERREAAKGLLSNLPVSLLIGGKGGCTLLIGGKGGCTLLIGGKGGSPPTRSVASVARGTTQNLSLYIYYLFKTLNVFCSFSLLITTKYNP